MTFQSLKTSCSLRVTRSEWSAWHGQSGVMTKKERSVSRLGGQSVPWLRLSPKTQSESQDHAPSLWRLRSLESDLIHQSGLCCSSRSSGRTSNGGLRCRDPVVRGQDSGPRSRP